MAPRAQCREGRTQELLASLLVPLQNQWLQPGHFQAGPPTGSLRPLPPSPYIPLAGGTTCPSPSATRVHKPCCPGVYTPRGTSCSPPAFLLPSLHPRHQAPSAAPGRSAARLALTTRWPALLTAQPPSHPQPLQIPPLSSP